jgi:hypothetical protein
MKKILILMAGLFSLPVLDYAAGSFHMSVSDTAEAYIARRSAFIARGPAGGVVAGVRRTAWGRGYGFLDPSNPYENEKRMIDDEAKSSLQSPDESQGLFKKFEEIQ